jgi:hypothetical protein
VRGGAEVLGQKTVPVNWKGLPPAVQATAVGGNMLELTNRHAQYKYLQSQCMQPSSYRLVTAQPPHTASLQNLTRPLASIPYPIIEICCQGFFFTEEVSVYSTLLQ